jgi:hypothetical protein
MFTIVGAAIGLFLGLITIVTNSLILASLQGLNLLLVYMIIMFSYLSFGAFSGMVIDLIIEKIK